MDDKLTEPFLTARVVGTVSETCSHGDKHEVKYVQTKRLFDTGRRESVHNGYDAVAERVLVDHQGREYVSHSPVDYWGSTFYHRREDKKSFSRMPPGLVRDLAGRPLTPGTPPGPPWTNPGR